MNITSPNNSSIKGSIKGMCITLVFLPFICIGCRTVSVNKPTIESPPMPSIFFREDAIPRDAPNPKVLAGLASEKFHSFPKSFKATVAAKILSVSVETRRTNASGEIGGAGLIEAEKFRYRFAATSQSQFEFECSRIPVEYPKEIFIADSKQEDKLELLYPLQLTEIGSNSHHKKFSGGKITSNGTNGVELQIYPSIVERFGTAKSAFEGFSKATGSVFVGTTLFGNDTQDSMQRVLTDSQALSVVGEERISGADYWIVKSVTFYRFHDTPGLYSLIWIEKQNHSVRRIVRASDVESGLMLWIEDFTF